MHPNGAKKNKLAQAIFSKEGPNLTSPAVTSRPNVTPKIYKVINKKIKGIPIFKIETPKKGIANRAAGTKPISVLKIAVKVSAAILYDFLFRSSISYNMMFLEEIWSRNFTNLFIAPIKLSEIIAALKIIPTVFS